MANKLVDPPKGFHWMKSGKGFKLMKGDYVKHPGACLLYTSPSPRDEQSSRMPSSA